MYIVDEINQVKRRDIEQIVCESLEDLITHDLKLLQNDVAERTITGHLARYIERRICIAELSVDCEYNRDVTRGEGHSKAVWMLGTSQSTYPDIIIHQRGTNNQNLLVIELKKTSSSLGSHEDDYRKLKAFTENSEQNSYHFRFGVFILIGVARKYPNEPALEWFIEGKKV